MFTHTKKLQHPAKPDIRFSRMLQFFRMCKHVSISFFDLSLFTSPAGKGMKRRWAYWSC